MDRDTAFRKLLNGREVDGYVFSVDFSGFVGVEAASGYVYATPSTARFLDGDAEDYLARVEFVGFEGEGSRYLGEFFFPYSTDIEADVEDYIAILLPIARRLDRFEGYAEIGGRS